MFEANTRPFHSHMATDHVHLALMELHWLPVANHIQYKVALLMFIAHDNRCPVYLSESVQPVSSNPARRHLRSASSLDFIVPRTVSILPTQLQV